MKKLSLILAVSMISGIYLNADSAECVQTAKANFAKKSMEISVLKAGFTAPAYFDWKEKEALAERDKEIAACEAAN